MKKKIYRVSVTTTTIEDMFVVAGEEQEIPSVVNEWGSNKFFGFKKVGQPEIKKEIIEVNGTLAQTHIASSVGIVQLDAYLEHDYYEKINRLRALVAQTMKNQGLLNDTSDDYYIRWEYCLLRDANGDETYDVDIDSFINPLCQGEVKIFYGNGKPPFLVLRDPNLIDVIVAGEKLIRLSDDRHHVYLDEIGKNEMGYYLSFGS